MASTVNEIRTFHFSLIFYRSLKRIIERQLDARDYDIIPVKNHRAITFTSYFRRKYLVSLDSLNLIFKNVFGEYVSNISRKKENTRAKIFEISALKYRYERDPRLFFPPLFLAREARIVST